MLIEKKVQDSIDLDVFLFLSIGLERGDMTLSATIFYSFCRCMPRPMAARAGLTAITTTSKHVLRQLPFLSKSYLYLFRKFRTKFPTD